MERTFLTDIEIKKVRHLENISILLDKNKRKHLILTGKNGSGKTSVLEAVVRYIQSFLGEHGTSFYHAKMMYGQCLNEVNRCELLQDLEENRKTFFKLKKLLIFGRES